MRKILVLGDWRKLHNEEPHDWHFLLDTVWMIQLRWNVMGNLKERSHFENLGTDGRIILKLFWMRECEVDYFGSQLGQVAGFCEHRNEHLGAKNCREFLDLLLNCWLLKKSCAAWRWLVLFVCLFTGWLVCWFACLFVCSLAVWFCWFGSLLYTAVWRGRIWERTGNGRHAAESRQGVDKSIDGALTGKWRIWVKALLYHLGTACQVLDL